MKCALELMAIATVKAEEIAKAKAEREAREREERIKCAIQICEEIGAKLERMAEQGETPTYTLYVNRFYRTLNATTSEYADGRTSYYASRNVSFEMDYLKEWFAQYCFIVEKKSFDFWQYGSGEQTGYALTIKPNPECL
jgi:hypothetical protein